MTRWQGNQETTVAHNHFIRVVLVERVPEATVSVRSAAALWKLRNKEKSMHLLILNAYFSIERDAQLLANRIALLK